MQSFKRQQLVLFLGLTMLISCAPKGPGPEQQAVEALEKEVLDIHDEVMPKMSRIESLVTSLEAELMKPDLDTLMTLDIQNSIANLKAGDSLMWDWMHNYKKPEDAPVDSLSAYLQSEKVKVTTMRNTMLKGIQNAESLVKKLSDAKSN